MSVEDDWKIVNHKKNRKVCVEKAYKTMDRIEDDILTSVSKYDPFAVFVFGSRARGTNRKNSDVDIMIFWKSLYFPDTESLQNLKDCLINKLELNVDVVPMELTKKCVDVTDERTQCFYDNILTDIVCIFPIERKVNSPSYFIELISKSIKHKKA